MRAFRVPVLAVTGVAAALSLTACQGKADFSGSAADTSSSSGSSGSSSTSGSTGTGSSGSSSSTGSSSGGTATTAADTKCGASDLSVSASGGLGDGEVMINLKDTGSRSCTIHGFAGVDVKSNYGTVSATRQDVTPTTVLLDPGMVTHFVLSYTPNTSGGSGVVFNTVVVTPPDDTHSLTLPLGDLAFSVAADSDSDSNLYIDPVGADS